MNLKVPDGDDYVELMLYATPPAPTQRGSAHHLALEVPDMDRSVAVLETRKAGAGYTRALEVRTGVNRKRQANLFDPDGTRTELMEPRTIRRDPDAVLDRAAAGVVVRALRDLHPARLRGRAADLRNQGWPPGPPGC